MKGECQLCGSMEPQKKPSYKTKKALDDAKVIKENMENLDKQLEGTQMTLEIKSLSLMQEILNEARIERDMDWNYFPVRKILPNMNLYAIGARLEFDKSITYITCDMECTPQSIKIVSVK